MAARKRPKSPRKRKRKAASHAPNKKTHMSLEEERTLFAKEQTLLSKERTILSFMRTGLTMITVGFAMIAASQILGSYFSLQPISILIIGWSVILIGLFEIMESYRRLRAYKKKMKEISDELGDENV